MAELTYTNIINVVSAKKWAFKIAPGSPMSLLCIIEQDKLRFRSVDFAVP